MSRADAMDIEVCYASPQGVERVALRVEAGCTVGDALALSGIVERLALDRGELTVAVFGRRAATDALLAPGDRVELLRPLVVDPMEARRRRAVKRSSR